MIINDHKIFLPDEFIWILFLRCGAMGPVANFCPMCGVARLPPKAKAAEAPPVAKMPKAKGPKARRSKSLPGPVGGRQSFEVDQQSSFSPKSRGNVWFMYKMWCIVIDVMYNDNYWNTVTEISYYLSASLQELTYYPGNSSWIKWACFISGNIPKWISWDQLFLSNFRFMHWVLGNFCPSSSKQTQHTWTLQAPPKNLRVFNFSEFRLGTTSEPRPKPRLGHWSFLQQREQPVRPTTFKAPPRGTAVKVRCTCPREGRERSRCTCQGHTLCICGDLVFQKVSLFEESWCFMVFWMFWWWSLNSK